MSDFNKVDLQDMVDHLRALGNGVADPEVKYLGICHELAKHFEECTNVVYELFKDWPKYTGSDNFPIPHESRTAMNAFVCTGNLWCEETQYGKD